MKTKFLKIALGWVVIVSLTSAPVRAASDVYAGDPPYATHPGGSISFVGEAAGSVVGRVFGIRGQGGDIRYHVIDLSGRSSASAAVRSALVPGWGQVFNRQSTKGALLFFTVAGAAAGSYLLHREAKDTYDEYKAIGDPDDSRYDDYKRQRTQSIVLGSAAAAIYLFSIVDAYLNPYAPYLSQSRGVRLSLGPGEGRFSFEKKF